MIFKHLFRSKHQNPDPQVRLQAIENLDSQDPQQKSILHELAFNDPEVKVNLAALDKLDSFVLWYKMAENAKNQRLQKKSQQYVEQALFDEQSSTLDKDEKRRFILETTDAKLIEKILNQAWVQQDPELALSLLEKLAKPHVNEKLLFEAKNEGLKAAILDSLTDSPQSRKILQKLVKKTSSEKIKTHADKLLTGWIQAQQAPIELEQKVTMLLSLLLALKEQQDLPHIQQQQKQLTEQYQQLSQDFSCLPEQKRQQIEAKFADISSKVSRTIDELLPKWQAKQAQLEIVQQVEQVTHQTEQQLADINQQISQRMSEISTTEVERFSTDANQLLSQIQALTETLDKTAAKSHKALEQLNNKLHSAINTLASLPRLQVAVNEAEDLLARFKELSLPTDNSQIDAAEEYLKEQKQKWRTATGEFTALMPKELVKQWRQQVELWQQGCKQLKTQIAQDVSRCRNKLRAVESLVGQGKYKAAMGLYQKVQNWYQALPEKQQGQLARSFNATKEQIENLKDWQEYIAAPRKPALLDQVQALIAKPLAIEAQAQAIKTLRQQWNSLGKTDTEADSALNQAFETEIEKAFAPCRAHYDKEQQAREQNLQAKQALLTELNALAKQQLAAPLLAKSLNNLQQQWRKIGEVDYKLRHKLYQDYQQAIAPLQEKVQAFYADNAEQKRQLVNKANKLLALEQVNDAIEQAKGLQQQWKTIEHAGKPAENKLWAEFKQATDKLFAKRNELTQQYKAQTQQQKEQVNRLLTELQQSLQQAADKGAVQQALQQLQPLLEAIQALPERERRGPEQQLQRLQTEQQNKLSKLKQAEKDQQYVTLFNCLAAWQDDMPLPEPVSELSKTWQSCFNSVNTDIDRHQLCIKMEILAQVDSPKKDAPLRQNIQMQLMAQKLQEGEALSLTALLKQWISAGALNKSDKTLLKRIKPLFVG